ncbi:hypothetical protein KNO81_30515 [Paraburkholderia sediminicola]|jgi:hypothetical protein|nr:hypothetical protein [Paraburkholderia sediminicola]
MSALTFLNKTMYPAQFVVHKGQQVVARLPGVAPGAELQVPADDAFQVSASTILEGDTYTSAPASVSGPMAFLAQVVENAQQGTYDFEMKVESSTAADQMVFLTTTINPVTFTISKSGVSLQSVVVQNSLEVETLTIGNDYTIFAVINGVTTGPVRTSDPNSVVTAVLNDFDLESGYFTLNVN